MATSSTVRSSAYENNPAASEGATWQQWAWFTGGCATVIITLAKSAIITAAAAGVRNSSWPWVQLISVAVAGYIAADLGTGIYHWAIDNYGGADTPVFGPQIVGFQGHHQRPSKIAREHIARNLYLTAAPVTVAVLPITVLCGDPAALGFVGSLAAAAVFSQQFHAWSHTPKGRLPVAVVALQDAGILLGRAEHAAHHRPPFDSNYCIVSGVWNTFIDKSRFFRALEAAVFAAAGVRPRSWSNPNHYEWNDN
ncbi:fatty acid desaturase 4, chloroplastic-like [Andrographis paniculata]|uniref:fatty acid desaturase 4, chloroplastic-like n=1 Tax=Andrographis paniculata TaxID=175694 RepID=UPI0021E92AB0|nr:fatty acid desaturase 4, chloroplastic-like [Andrographis paniculata]